MHTELRYFVCQPSVGFISECRYWGPNQWIRVKITPRLLKIHLFFFVTSSRISDVEHVKHFLISESSLRRCYDILWVSKPLHPADLKRWLKLIQPTFLPAWLFLFMALICTSWLNHIFDQRSWNIAVSRRVNQHSTRTLCLSGYSVA